MKYSAKTGCFYPDDIGYDDFPDDIIEVDQTEFERAMARQAGETFDVVDGIVRIIEAQPSAAHELVDGVWVLNFEKQAALEKAMRALKVPRSVSIRQAKRALLAVGLLDEVEGIMASDGVDRALKIDWQYATEVQRDWIEQSGLIQALGMDDDKLDQLFTLAATL